MSQRKDVTIRSRNNVARTATPPVYRLDHYRWRLLKRNHKQHSKIHNLPCWLHKYGMCQFHGAPIDYDAKPGTPTAYETDHKKPRATHPWMMYDWGNLEASHVRCNRKRGLLPVKGADTQQDWIKPTF